MDSTTTGDGGGVADGSVDGTVGDGSSMGGGDGAADATTDAGTAADSAVEDATADGGAKDGAVESGTDGAVACTGTGACAIGNTNGVCVGGVCSVCNGGVDSAGISATCTTAYGGATDPYICLGGSCVPGNCTVGSACTTAGQPTCGFTNAHFCGGCTSDGQCAATDICVTTTGTGLGTCVPANMGGCTANQSSVACPLNASDECCAGTCSPGNCCITAGGGQSGCVGTGVTCKADVPGETSGGGICTACLAVSGANPVYFVDPVNGSDTQGTGNNTGLATCAFRTIRRALQVIGQTAQPNTTIDLVGGAGVTVKGVAAGTPPEGQELFPLTIVANVTLTNSGGPVTVKVPARTAGNPTTGFLLAGDGATIKGGLGGALTIDGQARTATTGVSVQSAGTSLSAVTIQNFAVADVEVADVGTVASALAIGPGVQCLGSAADGLLISGTSTATVTGSATQATLFNDNAAHGIRVNNEGVLTLTGAIGATPPGTGTVVATGNGNAGIWIQSAPATPSTITGVVSTGSTAGNGIRIIPGANVKVRESWLLGNSQGSGIDVAAVAGGGPVGTIANIDLGTAAAPGGNVVQAASGNNPNGVSGICLTLPAGTAATLAAEGNIFTGGACIAARALDVRPNLACGGGADVGGSINPTATAGGNHIDVLMCTVP